MSKQATYRKLRDANYRAAYDSLGAVVGALRTNRYWDDKRGHLLDSCAASMAVSATYTAIGYDQYVSLFDRLARLYCTMPESWESVHGDKHLGAARKVLRGVLRRHVERVNRLVDVAFLVLD